MSHITMYLFQEFLNAYNDQAYWWTSPLYA